MVSSLCTPGTLNPKSQISYGIAEVQKAVYVFSALSILVRSVPALEPLQKLILPVWGGSYAQKKMKELNSVSRFCRCGVYGIFSKIVVLSGLYIIVSHLVFRGTKADPELKPLNLA